eukprot:g12470.t1
MNIKLALFNDRLIETQWGKNALQDGNGFRGITTCDLVKQCKLEIIKSTNTNVNKYNKKVDAFVHMAAKESGNRLVSMTLDTDWGKRIKVRRKQYKILYAGEGSMIPMDLYMKRFKFDAMVNYRLSSEIFLGHGCGAINRLVSMTKKEENKLYNPKEIFKRSGGDVAIFVSNCVGSRLKWIEALVKASKMNRLKVHSYGSCFHNVDMPFSRSKDNWFKQKMDILNKYKFSVAYENSIRDSYVSEKVFMSLEAGTIPLYHGTDKVKEMLPKGSTIYTDEFNNNVEKYINYLVQLKSNYDMFKKYFEWTLDNYRQMKIVNACKHSWQCAACGWVAKQKLERKQRKKKNKSFMKIKD